MDKVLEVLGKLDEDLAIEILEILEDLEEDLFIGILDIIEKWEDILITEGLELFGMLEHLIISGTVAVFKEYKEIITNQESLDIVKNFGNRGITDTIDVIERVGRGVIIDDLDKIAIMGDLLFNQVLDAFKELVENNESLEDIREAGETIVNNILNYLDTTTGHIVNDAIHALAKFGYHVVRDHVFYTELLAIDLIKNDENSSN